MVGFEHLCEKLERVSRKLIIIGVIKRSQRSIKPSVFFQNPRRILEQVGNIFIST